MANATSKVGARMLSGLAWPRLRCDHWLGRVYHIPKVLDDANSWPLIHKKICDACCLGIVTDSLHFL